MAQITEFTRDTLIAIHITMFNAVPGAQRLAWMIQQYESGMSQAQIAEALTSTYPEEFAAVAPHSPRGVFISSDVADRLLGYFGELIPTDAWTGARQWAWDMIDAGASYPQVIVQAVNALRTTPNAGFANAKALIENKIALARHIALDLQHDPINLIEAQDLIAFVDHLPRSVEITKQYWAAKHQEGAILSSDVDTLTAEMFRAFAVYDPGKESYINTLQPGDVLTGIGASATLNAAIISRDFVPQFAPTLHDIAAINLWITGTRMLTVDLQHASDLRNLMLNSNVRVNLRGLRTDGQADGRHLEIDARGAADYLLMPIDAPLDAGQAEALSHDALRDLVILTGQGSASISIDGGLAGSIQGNGGRATINVGRPSGGGDILGISSIHNAAGKVTVLANDMLATASDKGVADNAGFDDVSAATISADSGDIYVGHLLASQDWDGADRFKWIGASIAMTGAGANRMNFQSMADGTSISTGAGDDSVRVMELPNGAVLAGDSDGDGRGAILDLGTGADTLSFEVFESQQATHTAIVGRGARVQGAEKVRVEALDRVTVTAPTSPSDTELSFSGTRILDLEINNQILETARVGGLYNDDDDSDGSIEVDLQRFDAALELVLMTSGERVDTLFDGGSHYGRPGAPTAFKLHNVRPTTELMLDASDATSHASTPDGIRINDTLLSIDRDTGIVTSNAQARDLSLWLSHADARGLNDHASLQLFWGIDLDLTLAPTTTDVIGDDASSGDDDSMTVEHFTLQPGAGSPSISFNGFGDVAHRLSKPPAQAADISSPVETSLSIDGLGSIYTAFIEGVNADTITLNGGESTNKSDGAMVLRVDAPNNYRIKTISGADTLDMRADTVRADDGESEVDRADYIDAGRGFDTLIISGDNHLGRNDLQPTAKAITSDDDVFYTLAGIEEILVDTDHGGTDATQMLTLDDAVANTGLERLRFTGGDTHTVHMVIGENYSRITPKKAALTLQVDAGAHEGDFNLVLDNHAQRFDERDFNLGIQLRAAGASAVNGDNLLMLDSGDEQQSLDLTLTTSRELDTHLFDGTASAAGHVGLRVARGSIDSITLIDGGEQASGVERTFDTYEISPNWTWDEEQFRFDASAIADTDNDATTGGLDISAKHSDASENILLGSQNADIVVGSEGWDTIEGGAGDDSLDGGAGDDTLNGNTGMDRAIFRGDPGDYHINRVDATTHIINATSGDEGQDLLLNIERFIFEDIGIAFDLDGAAGVVAKTIGAVFGASLVADERLVGIGLSRADQDLNYEALMTLAINNRLEHDVSPESVVELLYSNVVGTPPDNFLKDKYIGWLEQGSYTIGELGMFAADQDLNLNNIGLVGLAETGLEFLPPS